MQCVFTSFGVLKLVSRYIPTLHAILAQKLLYMERGLERPIEKFLSHFMELQIQLECIESTEISIAANFV